MRVRNKIHQRHKISRYNRSIQRSISRKEKYQITEGVTEESSIIDSIDMLINVDLYQDSYKESKMGISMTTVVIDIPDRIRSILKIQCGRHDSSCLYRDKEYPSKCEYIGNILQSFLRSATNQPKLKLNKAYFNYTYQTNHTSTTTQQYKIEDNPSGWLSVTLFIPLETRVTSLTGGAIIIYDYGYRHIFTQSTIPGKVVMMPSHAVHIIESLKRSNEFISTFKCIAHIPITDYRVALSKYYLPDSDRCRCSRCDPHSHYNKCIRHHLVFYGRHPKLYSDCVDIIGTFLGMVDTHNYRYCSYIISQDEDFNSESPTFHVDKYMWSSDEN